jgi:DNA-binding beta-propeller fold protein YncE
MESRTSAFRRRSRRAVQVTMGCVVVLVSAGVSLPAARAQSELFVSNNNSITVYSAGASGNAAPIRTLNGMVTGQNETTGVVADTVNNELMVADAFANAINVYTLTASGNTAPIRTLAGAATGLSEPNGLFVDTVNDELVVTNDDSGTYSVMVYSRTASGNTAPIRTIVGGATGLELPYGVFVDTVNNELVVANRAAINGGSITVFARTAGGNAAPIRTLSGAAVGFNGPIGVVVDTVNNELIVTSEINNSVRVFSRTASGNTAPIRTISGAATGLSTPDGVAVDTVNNELFVANDTNDSVTVYNRTANGNVAPIRTISGAATGLDGPFYLVLGTPTSPPLAVTLLNPNANAVIAQNQGIPCPSDPARGTGYKIKFGWAYVRPPNFSHFHLHVQRVGAPLATVDVNLTTRTFKLLACNSVVIDSDLANWYWQVTAVDNSGSVLATSVQRPFSFAACRLSNGAACAP